MPEEENPDFPNLQDIEKEMASKDQENQYLRGRNFGLQDAVESGGLPRNDANVIEYKLSSEELLERIENYLKGNILKTRVNEQNEVESFYVIPTKKISVNLYRNERTGRVYVVDEHQTGKENEKWFIMSIFEKDEKQGLMEIPIEDNYREIILNELQRLLQSKAKNPPIKYLGFATKEVLDPARINLNEYGVQEVMNILSMYITKETFLSYYKEERIYEILGDLGNQLNKFFLINSKQIGLDTEYKKTKYPVIIVTILHTVESAYRRALMGNENRGTREGIIISQHQPLGQMPYSMPMPKKKWSLFDRNTW